MATWPATLPQSLLMGINVKRKPGGKIRSGMDTGPAKQRPRFTAVVKQYTSALIMTGAQLAIFESFYEDDLGQGALPFDWKDPVTDAAASLRFFDEYEVTQIVAHQDPAERKYSITMPLEKLP